MVAGVRRKRHGDDLDGFAGEFFELHRDIFIAGEILRYKNNR